MATVTETERLAGDIKVLNRWTVLGGIFGLTSAVVYNGLARRPIIAGFHKHIISVSIGCFLGYKTGQWQDRKWAERVYLIREYRERNAHLFPEESTAKHIDINKPFYPRH